MGFQRTGDEPRLAVSPGQPPEPSAARILARFLESDNRIRQNIPDVTIRACASGGGRANYAAYCLGSTSFGVSDNTDALQRVFMQWGTSHFFPAVAMGSHISATPNHQTFRTIPMKFRIDVGYERPPRYGDSAPRI